MVLLWCSKVDTNYFFAFPQTHDGVLSDSRSVCIKVDCHILFLTNFKDYDRSQIILLPIKNLHRYLKFLLFNFKSLALP